MIFREEYQLLKSAKQDLSHHENQGLPAPAVYAELIAQYEKLLKVSAKIIRISDIQGESLKKQEDVITTMNEHLLKIETSRRRFLSDISHELFTPMTTIQGYIKAMLDGVVEPEKPFLQMIYDKILLVNKLVEDLFEASKLEANMSPIEIREIGLSAFLENIEQIYSVEVTGRGFSFQIEPAGDLARHSPVRLWMDPVRIEQVLNNLVHNAMKFCPKGGNIRITVEWENAARRMVKFQVSDDGPGISEADIPHVFDRFYKGESNPGQQIGMSLGVGLAIAKEIIIKHKGEIGVRSEAGVGTTFFFTLPVAAAPRKQSDA
ncbi:sensor histidine kinase [Paenibacillus thermotolerans]|uniref:sensor histidine kinase n=1 Tax=Paenibacillus thermotolerans TaxID=3027807 RepID=UPI00236849A7|nr:MULTISPECIES: HAMP domain-containing sensor histidine kinase [unclassified Paenibacillus]